MASAVEKIFTLLILATVIFCLPLPAQSRTPVSASDVLRLTYQQSLKSQQIKTQSSLAKEGVKTALSQYDTTVSGSSFYTKDNTERSTVIFGTSASSFDSMLGISQQTPTGTLFNLGFSYIRQTSNSPFTTNPTLHESRMQLGLVQPLAKNAFGTKTRKTISLAKALEQKNLSEVESHLQKLAYQNLLHYWTLYFFEGAALINKEAVHVANKLYQTNQNKLNLGLIEKFDLSAFSANVNLKKNDLLLSQAEQAKTAGDLQAALGLAGGSLTSKKETFVHKKSHLDILLAEAVAHHPEYLALEQDLKAQNIEIKIKKNGRLPEIDLAGSFALNGLDPAAAQAVSDLGKINPIYQAGLSVKFPLQNRLAKSELKTSEILRQRKILALKDKENEIITMVRQHFERIKLSHARIQTTQLAMQNLKDKWEGETLRYDQGRSDPDQVIRSQDDYLNARLLNLKAKVDYQLALLDLNYWSGKLVP